MPPVRKGKVVENKVARNYEKAGYKVKTRTQNKSGERDVTAQRGKEKLMIEVKHRNKPGKIPSNEIEKIAKKAKYSKAKPVMVLSGKAELTSNARKLANKLGVRVKKRG